MKTAGAESLSSPDWWESMSMKQHRLPDAIGIGTRRCATSWLNRVLLTHPQIGTPDGGLHFFSQEFDRGIEWYKDQLSIQGEKRVLLELSVSYAYPEYYQLAARRIHDSIPDARLFLTVRNPVERAFSDYRRAVSRVEISPKLSFREAIREFPNLLERGLYAKVIEEYMRFFPRDKIRVMFLEDLEADPRAYVGKLLEYLGVDTSIETGEYDRRSLSPASPRVPVLARGIYGFKNSIDGGADSLGLSIYWRRFKRKHIYTFISLMSWNYQDQGLSHDDRNFLADFYSDDIRRLERITKRDLTSWLIPGRREP